VRTWLVIKWKKKKKERKKRTYISKVISHGREGKKKFVLFLGLVFVLVTFTFLFSLCFVLVMFCSRYVLFSFVLFFVFLFNKRKIQGRPCWEDDLEPLDVPRRVRLRLVARLALLRRARRERDPDRVLRALEVPTAQREAELEGLRCDRDGLVREGDVRRVIVLH
jgi:hypothetical protein